MAPEIMESSQGSEDIRVQILTPEYGVSEQAAGDTQTPLYTLLIAMSLNTILDLLFVVKMQMGTRGTAIATVTAQFTASVICICVMRRKHPEFFFGRSDLVIDKNMVTKTAKFGVVSALHQSSLYIGKLLVQGAVNTGGTDMISAYTATMRMEGFANSFSDSGAVAISVFVAQNRGAGDKKRARAGFVLREAHLLDFSEG